jgi:hypothetical protein
MTTSPIAIDRALMDPRLLGAAVGDISPWSTWMVALKSAFGLGLITDKERETFATIAGNRSPPEHRVREFWCLVGRRGGKSRIAAALAVFFSCFVPHKVAKGERPMVLVLAMSTDQALSVFTYAKAFLTESPVLRREIDSITRNEIRLKNGVTIAIHANSFRSVRGRTLLACIFDEVAYWRDDTSATPDTETYSAVKPGLASTSGMLIGISTPYRKTGLLHQKWRDHFGVDGDTLVVQGPTSLFNPSLSTDEIASQRAADPTAAGAEWDAEFRTELTAYLDDALIERAIAYGRPLELPPRPGITYQAHIDASGGVGNDSYTCCIAHKENDQYVIDLCRGTVGAFDPHEITRAYAALLKEFWCYSVCGDFYGAEWVTSAWSATGIRYTRSPIAKSQIYQEVAPLFARGLVSLPDHPQLRRELRLLERRTHRSGKDSVDHGRNGHDDFANAMAGVLRTLSANASTADLLELYRRANGDSPAPPSLGLHPQYQQFADPPPSVDAAWRQMVEDTCNAWKG